MRRKVRRGGKGKCCTPPSALHIVSHNVGGLSDTRFTATSALFTAPDQRAPVVFCFQETHLAHTPTVPGYTVYTAHRPEGQGGGGLATLFPASVSVHTVIANQFCLRTTTTTASGTPLHILNVYLPPASSLGVIEDDLHAGLSDIVDGVPVTDAIVVVGDFNAHVAAHAHLLPTTCACH